MQVLSTGGIIAGIVILYVPMIPQNAIMNIMAVATMIMGAATIGVVTHVGLIMDAVTTITGTITRVYIMVANITTTAIIAAIMTTTTAVADINNIFNFINRKGYLIDSLFYCVIVIIQGEASLK